MALLHWRPNMSLGIAALDADHRHLIDLLNRLHFMFLAGDENAAVGDVLDELLAYTRRHFAREEAVMRRTGYPGFQRHRQQHRELADRLAVFRARFDAAPDQFDMAAFYDFLSEWLLVHVLDEDMKLKPYVAAGERVLAHAE